MKQHGLGLDTSSFKILRQENNIYVDKTKWLHNLVTKGRAYFLSRPRRFGKSLTISTFKELFTGNKDLFKGLYIENRWKFEKYPVLIFDFNEIENKTTKALNSSLRYLLKKKYKNHSMDIPDSDSIPILFAELIQDLHEKLKQKIVILVDEYDKPIIDHLGKNEIETAKQNREVLESLFGILKGANIVDLIQFVFVTGVSRFSKVSIFSKWNNLKDITMVNDYADFLGYSENEIRTDFKEYLHEFCKEKDLAVEECLDKLKLHYDGYRFSRKNVKVFNPISIMNCLKDKEFDNFWFSTATPSFLVNLIKEKDYFIPDLEQIEMGASMLETFDIESIDIEPMLFQTGYLTIKDFDGTLFYLSYPNAEVKKSFNEILLKHVSEKAGTISFAQRLGKSFKNGNYEDVKFYINAIFNDIPYPHFKNADENYFHTIIYMALSLIGYNAQSELLNSRGRLDLALIFPDKVFIIEFKCNLSAEKAINQIKEKKYADKWKNKKTRTICVGINFDTKEREVKEILFEE